MDALRLDAIAHRDHVFLNPLSGPKVDQVLLLLGLARHARVIDVGCGKGEMLVRLIERYGVRGTGVDPNPRFIAEARARAAARVPEADLVFHEASIADVPVAPASLDAACCVGSTHAYGGYREALRSLAAAVKPGGRVLAGQGFWRRPPPPGAFAAAGAETTGQADHAGNVLAGVEVGLVAVCTAVSSEDEWEHYQRLYLGSLETHAAEHPADPGGPALRAHAQRAREAWERWGRESLGFGLYLFQKK